MTKFIPNNNIKHIIKGQLSKFKNNKKLNTFLHVVNDIINDKETTRQEILNGLNPIIKYLNLLIENQLMFPTTLHSKGIPFKKQQKVSTHSTPIITFHWRRERLLKNYN